MEPFPDLGTLSDKELKELIRDLVREEDEISRQRRLLHGKIDILRAELVARMQRKVAAGQSPLEDLDVAKLTAILSSKAAPPADVD